MSTLASLWTAARPTRQQAYLLHFLDPKEVTRACDLKFWPQLHFEEGKKTPRIDVELSIVDTALFCLGVICVKEYFNQGTPRERVLRELANQHICRPRWDSLLTEHNLLRMGWKPETGMLDATFKGFNEGLLLYLVALGSPTHRIPDESWRAQLAGVQPQTDYGETFLRMHDFPLFGYHYPLCWFDFRELFDPLNQESGFDYFENAQRAVRAQYLYRWHRAWCCGHCTSGLKNARFRFTETGVVGAFNMSADRSKPTGWVAPDQIGVDVGCYVLMIEIARDMFEKGNRGLVWSLVMQSHWIQHALQRAGFTKRR